VNGGNGESRRKRGSYLRGGVSEKENSSRKNVDIKDGRTGSWKRLGVGGYGGLGEKRRFRVVGHRQTTIRLSAVRGVWYFVGDGMRP